MKTFEHPKVFGLVTKYPKKRSNKQLVEKKNACFKRRKMNAVYIVLETREPDLKKLRKALKLMDISGVDYAPEYKEGPVCLF